MSIFSFKKQTTLSLVCDLRDSSVSVAAVLFAPSKKPELFTCAQAPIEIREFSSDIQGTKKRIAALARALAKAELLVRRSLIKTGNKLPIGDRYFFVGSPYSASQAKLIHIIKDKQFEITDAFLARIISTQEHDALLALVGAAREKEWEVLEEKIIQTRLAGYRVSDVLGKETTDFAMELYTSFVSRELLSRLAVFAHDKNPLHFKKHLHSSAIASYTFLRDLFSNKNNFIFLDVGQFITDIAIVRDDCIETVASFPIGERAIVAQAAEDGKTSEQSLRSELSAHAENHLSIEAGKKTVDGFRTGAKAWFDTLSDILSQVSTEATMPDTIFIVPHTPTTQLIGTLLSGTEEGPITLVETPMRVEVITEGIINNFISGAKACPNEPYVKMDIVFLEKMLKQKQS